MSRDLILSTRAGRNWQAPLILVAAVAQIVCARLTDFFHVGQSVEVRSLLAQHPLVPLGYAFAIWGVIYLYSFVGALWQMGRRQRNDMALREVGWNMAGIYAVNALWQIWVPLRGLDMVSVVLVAFALLLGIAGLMSLRQMPLTRAEEWLVAGPLALVTGWLTAAFVLNVTSMLVAQHSMAIDPMQPGVSMAFLAVLIVAGGVIARATQSLLYGVALVWALAWIMIAAIYREHDIGLATLAGLGLIAVAGLSGWRLYHDHHDGRPIHA
jgi:hypothetical protein